MSKFNWVGFVACRYTSNKASRSSASSTLAILEIAVGVLALTVIIAVMNGFQLGYIESILEVSSYYVRVDNFPADNTDVIDKIKKLSGVRSVVSFKETEGIMRGLINGAQSPVVLRGLPSSVFSIDEGMKDQLKIVDSVVQSKDDMIATTNAILLGSELARMIGVDAGDAVEFISMADLFSSDEELQNSSFIVTGIFKSGYYQYDLNWGFINLNTALDIESAGETLTLGIKLLNRYQDLKAVSEIRGIINAELSEETIQKNNIAVSSWRDYNKAFFGALRTEKLLMFVLVGLIFIVVALNIFQAQRRSVLERSEEIGLLRAVGASDFQVRCIFTFNGILIGFIGASSGMALALLISTHIQKFFSLIETIVSLLMRCIYRVAYGSIASGADFAIFNRKIFYLDGITSRIMTSDIIIIYLFGLLSAVFAAWFASKRIARINPADVLRYE
ncbi:MAG: FtsX-like permease family protein [Spirochaetaceae bacterium]|jgi:lipoprotein-releasing system permease protein|nr:FtsX-like permease family protein [Spirochaetaceae bacterium]